MFCFLLLSRFCAYNFSYQTLQFLLVSKNIFVRRFRISQLRICAGFSLHYSTIFGRSTRPFFVIREQGTFATQQLVAVAYQRAYTPGRRSWERINTLCSKL